MARTSRAQWATTAACGIWSAAGTVELDDGRDVQRTLSFADRREAQAFARDKPRVKETEDRKHGA
jgi:hypothetical protein